MVGSARADEVAKVPRSLPHSHAAPSAKTSGIPGDCLILERNISELTARQEGTPDGGEPPNVALLLDRRLVAACVKQLDPDKTKLLIKRMLEVKIGFFILQEAVCTAMTRDEIAVVLKWLKAGVNGETGGYCAARVLEVGGANLLPELSMIFAVYGSKPNHVATSSFTAAEELSAEHRALLLPYLHEATESRAIGRDRLFAAICPSNATHPECQRPAVLEPTWKADGQRSNSVDQFLWRLSFLIAGFLLNVGAYFSRSANALRFTNVAGWIVTLIVGATSVAGHITSRNGPLEWIPIVLAAFVAFFVGIVVGTATNIAEARLRLALLGCATGFTVFMAFL